MMFLLRIVYSVYSFHTKLKSSIAVTRARVFKHEFSQQTNCSMKISILGYTSAENEDKRSIKITRIGELHSTTCECTTKRCKIFYLQIF